MKMIIAGLGIVLLILLLPASVSAELPIWQIPPPEPVNPVCWDQYSFEGVDPELNFAANLVECSGCVYCQVAILVGDNYLNFAYDDSGDYSVSGLYSHAIQVRRDCADCVPMRLIILYVGRPFIYLPLVGR